MRAIRTGLGVLGAASLAVAGGTVLVPGLAAGLDVTATFGNDYLFVVPIALATVSVVVGVVASRTARGVDQARPPDPEGVPTADSPSAEFDRLVEGGWPRAIGAHRNAERLRGRLREAAIRTVMRTDRCSREAATRHVDEGTWTDDAVAAAFVARDRAVGGDRAAGGDATRVTVGALRRREVPIQWRARRAALAIDLVGREEPA